MRNQTCKTALSWLALTLAVLIMPASSWGASYKVLKALYGLDGAGPVGDLVFDAAGNLYGTARSGGGPLGTSDGSVFMLTPSNNGPWSEKALFVFTRIGSDGEFPRWNPVLDSQGNVYGITEEGGHYNGGTIFELTPDGSGFWSETLVYEFNYPNGTFPNALMRDSAGNFYGTTQIGGVHGWADRGLAYELSPNIGGGDTQTVLHYFTTADYDGAGPASNLAQDSAGNFYGTTKYGGLYGYGTVFQIAKSKLGGWHEEVIYSFDGTDGSYPYGNIAVDAAGNIYGTTEFGGSTGSAGYGNVFEVSPGGKGTWTENIIHTFSYKNNDGTTPMGGVSLDPAGNVWGTTYYGGASGLGTIFEFTPSSGGTWTGKILHNFSGTDGANPFCALIFDSAGNAYGTTEYGGTGPGVVFEMTP